MSSLTFSESGLLNSGFVKKLSGLMAPLNISVKKKKKNTKIKQGFNSEFINKEKGTQETNI